MSRFFATVLLALCAALTANAANKLTLVFEEDFSKPTLLWGAAVRNGRLVLDRRDIDTPIELDDFVLEYDTAVMGEGISEVRFRIDEESGRYYMFRVDTRGDAPGYKPGFLMAGPGRDLPWWLVGERLGHAPKPNSWVHVRLEAVGERMVAYLDGKLVARYHDKTLCRGTLGFKHELCPAAFDNLKIYAPPGAHPYVPQLKPRRHHQPVSHNPYLNPAWTAHWIWAKGDANNLDRWLRKSFALPRQPDDAHIALTADNEYTLYINGQRVGSDNDWYGLETYDVRRYLRAGRNVIAVRVHNEAPGAAGLLLEGWANFLDAPAVHIISDTSWKASARQVPGWQRREFDDAAWHAAISLGRHPCPPWGEQSNLRLPFLGPKQGVKLVAFDAPSRIVPGQPFEVNASFRTQTRLLHDYPLVVTASVGRERVDLGVTWPEPPTRQWATGAVHAVKATARVGPRLWYLVGSHRVELRVELRGTMPLPGSAPSARSVTLAPPIESSRPRWVIRDGRLFDGRVEYRPIDEEGVYFYRVAPAQPPMPKPKLSTAEIVNRRGLDSALRCELVDSIDCTKRDHEFSEDYGLAGHSRVLKIGDRRYRVTSARPKESYFFYTIRVRRPGEPHLLVAEIPNDIERYTTIRVYPRGPGCGIYTGREYPCDGRPVLHMFLFYPTSERVRISVSRWPCELERRPNSGAAVSRIWVFDILDPLAARAVTPSRPKRGPQRRFGMYLTAAPYIYSMYGFSSHSEQERRASIRSFIDYMKFCGMNLLEYNAIDGGDIAETAHYDSKIYKASRFNVFRDLLPAAERAGIEVVPIVTSLACPSWRRGVDKTHRPYPGWSELSYQWDKNGRTRTSFFGVWLPDPLRPEVQELLFQCLREICERAKPFRCVPAIGFRVNGKIGLCYAGSRFDRCGQDTGYSPWDIAQFRKDTAIAVPDMKPTPYRWLREHAWKEWLEWRCRRTRDFWLRARRLVQSYRPDWTLLVSCDLPSETPGYNIEWPAGTSPLELMRHHGFDPRLFVNDRGIVLQRGMMISSDRYWTRIFPYSKNVWAHKAFSYAPGVTDLYRTREGAACEFYHNYWEEGAPGGVGTFPRLAAGTMYPPARYYFEPIAFSLEKTNPRTMVVFSWERGSAGHEHDIRRFGRAFRSLPYCEPRQFDGECRILWERPKLPSQAPSANKPSPMRTPYRSTKLWVNWLDDRLAVLNATDAERGVELKLAGPWAHRRELVELGSGKKMPVRNGRIQLVLSPYDLLVLAAR